MTCITDLPEDILFQIFGYLSPGPRHVPIHGQPFNLWPAAVMERAFAVDSQNKDIRSLLFSCKALYIVALRSLFTHAGLVQRVPPKRPNLRNRQRLHLLTLAVTNKPYLGESVRTVHIDLDKHAAGFHKLFFLPKIQSLSIRHFEITNTIELETPEATHALIGTSPLKSLYLIECGSREGPLEQILSWPSALESLHYECLPSGWYDYARHAMFTTAAVGRAISSQASSLAKLVFSRGDDYRWWSSAWEHDVFDLSSFSRLQSLCISHAFLVGRDEKREVHMTLPKSLIELEIYNEFSKSYKFLSESVPRQQWLFEILDNKSKSTPVLERVRIISREWDTYMRPREDPPPRDEDEDRYWRHWHGDYSDDSEEEDEDQDEENEDEEEQDEDDDDEDAVNQQQPSSQPEPAPVTDFSQDGVKIVGDNMVNYVIVHDPEPDPGLVKARDWIVAFGSAGVSLSVYLHPLRRFKATVVAGKGFDDAWEDTWHKGDS